MEQVYNAIVLLGELAWLGYLVHELWQWWARRRGGRPEREQSQTGDIR